MCQLLGLFISIFSEIKFYIEYIILEHILLCIKLVKILNSQHKQLEEGMASYKTVF